MEHYDIFISYKRDDKERVFAIKDYIEKSVGVKCWIDLNGIESDAQFVNVIMNAIDKSTVFLFMYSHTHSIIEDYETDWTVREINYAQSLKKRIVFINIDGSPLTKYFIFMFPQKQQVDATSESAKEKLCKDLKKWLNIKEPEVQPNEGSHYKGVNDTKSQPVTTKNNIYAQDEKEKIIVLSNEVSKFVKDDKNHSGQIIKQEKKHNYSNITTHILKNNRLWIVGVAGLLVLVLLLYVFGGKQDVNNELSNRVTKTDSSEALPNNTTLSFEGKEILAQNQIPSDFILVPGGQFSYRGNYYENYKVHNFDIDSFYICKYELTQGEYKRVMNTISKENRSWLANYERYNNDKPIYVEYKNDSIPVRGSFKEFAEYCNIRSEKEGYEGFYIISNNSIQINDSGNGYRLVTPYEWIIAAYGGNMHKKERYLGGSSLNEVAWHQGNSKNRPHPVGLKKPNAIGIYDMQGNAPEILQGDNKRKIYHSMMGRYDVSDWNYSQTYDPTNICAIDDQDVTEWCYGTRIAFIPRGIRNKNLRVLYDY